MERSRLSLARNDGRKSRKVILLYTIFYRVIIYFRFVGFFTFSSSSKAKRRSPVPGWASASLTA